MTSLSATPSKLTAGQLPKRLPLLLGAIVLAATCGFFALQAAATKQGFNVAGAVVVAFLLYVIIVSVMSNIVEGRRKALDRFIRTLIQASFVVAVVPLVSLIYTVIAMGRFRFDMDFFTMSMRNIIGAGGGALHGIVGTLLITLVATLISVPIGIMTAIYLTEYGGKSALAKAVTFLVDVMTGIPSIVAGLFVFALFSILVGPGTKMGFAGSIALSVLMIPVVVRSCEEMLRIVPADLREASLALGVPKWRTITKIVLPTAASGIISGVMIAIARVIGETAPLLIVAGYTLDMNYNLFANRMMTLPVYVYYQWSTQGVDANAFVERAWTGALVLIIIVMLLNLLARLVAKFLSPKAR